MAAFELRDALLVVGKDRIDLPFDPPELLRVGFDGVLDSSEPLVRLLPEPLERLTEDSKLRSQVLENQRKLALRYGGGGLLCGFSRFHGGLLGSHREAERTEIRARRNRRSSQSQSVLLEDIAWSRDVSREIFGGARTTLAIVLDVKRSHDVFGESIAYALALALAHAVVLRVVKSSAPSAIGGASSATSIASAETPTATSSS